MFVTDLGDGLFRATILSTTGDRRFFRVRFGDTNSEPTTLAWFDMAELSAAEGDGSYFVTVHFSESYTGPLRYSWSGGANVGGLAGVVDADGTSVQIPLVIGDDTEIGELQQLTLTLVTRRGHQLHHRQLTWPGRGDHAGHRRE